MIVNHKEAEPSYSLPPEGEYECMIEQAAESATLKLTPFLDIRLRIRTDVPNPCAGILFHRIWKKRQPTPADIACEGYVAWQVQSLSKAAQLPDGKEYATLDDWCADLIGRCIRVTVEHEEYNGRKRARVQHVDVSEVQSLPPEAFKEFDDSDEPEVPF